MIIRGPKPGVLKTMIFKIIEEIAGSAKIIHGCPFCISSAERTFLELKRSENFLCTKHGMIHEQDVVDNMDELIEQLFMEINQAAEVLGEEVVDIVLDALVKANLVPRFRLNSYQQGSKIKDTLHFIYRSNRAGTYK